MCVCFELSLEFVWGGVSVFGVWGGVCGCAITLYLKKRKRLSSENISHGLKKKDIKNNLTQRR